MRELLIVVPLAALAVGCWVSGQVRYRNHPDLAAVKLASGDEKNPPAGQLGTVSATAEGYDACDRLIANALRELLAESRALGGTGVQQVKFRRRWHWSGREPMCRRSLLGRKSLEARGIAVK